jgi:hypothetical protein
LVTAPGASQRETGPITIRKGDVVDASTTTRTGKVLSFFGVLFLVLGLLQSGAGAANERANSSLNKAPGQVKKHQAPETDASASSADSASSSNDSSDCGAYCSTTDGTPSGNGNGGGNGNQPCAGCVGNADNENPGGQHHDGSDSNNGYECDGNNGIAKGNPAHSVCHDPAATTTTTPQQTTTTVAQQTTTTAPLTTTTTAAGATTTTAAVQGATSTTSAEVLGVQFSRGEEQARGLASTGAGFFRPFTMLGALLLLIGMALMTIKLHPLAKA